MRLYVGFQEHEVGGSLLGAGCGVGELACGDVKLQGEQKRRGVVELVGRRARPLCW